MEECGVKVPSDLRRAFAEKGYIALDSTYDGRIPVFELAISCQQAGQHEYHNKILATLHPPNPFEPEAFRSQDDLWRGVAYRWNVRATAVGTLKDGDGTVIREFRVEYMEMAPNSLEFNPDRTDLGSRPTQSFIEYQAKQKVIPKFVKRVKKELPSPAE